MILGLGGHRIARPHATKDAAMKKRVGDDPSSLDAGWVPWTSRWAPHLTLAVNERTAKFVSSRTVRSAGSMRRTPSRSPWSSRMSSGTMRLSRRSEIGTAARSWPSQPLHRTRAGVMLPLRSSHRGPPPTRSAHRIHRMVVSSVQSARHSHRPGLPLRKSPLRPSWASAW